MMTATSRPTPTSDAQVFALLHERFGIGDWDEDSSTPWHKVVIREASKIKAIRTRRRLMFQDFVMVADYCQRNGIYPKTVWELLSHYGQARLDQIVRKREAPSQLDLELDMAIENERLRPDGDETWARRLATAAGPARQEVLDEWRRERA